MSHNDQIATILRESGGGLLSNEISKKLIDEFKMSRTSALRAVSRAKDPVQKVEQINFSNNKKFYYIGKFSKVKGKFHKYCNKEKIAESYILNAMRYRGGGMLMKNT